MRLDIAEVEEELLYLRVKTINKGRGVLKILRSSGGSIWFPRSDLSSRIRGDWRQHVQPALSRPLDRRHHSVESIQDDVVLDLV